MTAAAQVDAELAAIALHGYQPRACACGVNVEPRWGVKDERLQMSIGPDCGRVPTVVWDCPGCGEKRAEPHEERSP